MLRITGHHERILLADRNFSNFFSNSHLPSTRIELTQTFFSIILVDSPLVLIDTVGDPVNNTDFDAVCIAQFYPGVPLEVVRIRWYDGDGNEVISDLPRVEVGSVEQMNETHFVRQISLRPTILEDSNNYTCVAYAGGDLLFSRNGSATVEFIVERKYNKAEILTTHFTLHFFPPLSSCHHSGASSGYHRKRNRFSNLHL